MPTNTCEICGTPITRRAKRCNAHRKTPANPNRWTAFTRPDLSGPQNPNWRGGVRRSGKGGKYVLRLVGLEHPSRIRRNGKPTYVMEHRLVMEAHLGRYLERDEYVHHRNGIKDDNRLENLELVTRARHRGEVTCPHCRQVFQLR